MELGPPQLSIAALNDLQAAIVVKAKAHKQAGP
jgi:hypothetical protein